MKKNEDDLYTHKNDALAHTSENISHADGSVKVTLDNHEDRIVSIETIGTSSAEASTINVKSFGAEGDGVTDDAPFIQAALDYAKDHKLSVRIPDGTYLLNSTLTVYQGTDISVGSTAKLIRNHPDCMVLNGKQTDSFTLYNGNSNITIEGGIWDAKGTMILNDGSVFSFAHANNIRVRNVTFKDLYNSHAIELCSLNGVVVEDCIFDGYTHDGSRGFVEAIQIEQATSSGFPWFGSGDGTICKNVIVRNCSFDNWTVAVGSHTSLLGVDGLLIEGCKINTTFGGITSQYFKNVTIKDNRITSAKGIYVNYDGTATKVLIENNYIDANGGYGIYLDNVLDVTIVNNPLIKGSTIAIQGATASNVKVNRNTLEATTSDTVQFSVNSFYVDVDNNTIKFAGRHGINAFNNCRFLKLLNNTILDVTTAAFNLQGATTGILHIKGNMIVDTTLTNVLIATSGVDHMFFNDNYYAASIITPISSAALTSDVTGNHTF